MSIVTSLKNSARIRVDVDKCIGAGQCVRAAPTIFSQNDEDGIVVLLQERVAQELTGAATTAAKWCPARAIIVEPDDDDHSRGA